MPSTSAAPRDELHRIAVHIVARARSQATGRFSLRVTPGGFGSPEFGDDLRRVRVARSALVVESDRAGAAEATALAIEGRSLADLADLAGVDLAAPLDVGHDTPDLGDPTRTIHLDPDVVDTVTGTLARFAAGLDATLAAVGGERPATPPRLWPEHFDVAIEVAAHPDRRVNLGGSPGDAFSDAPYAYVGPWTSDRPGGGDFWNAPFGAARPLSEFDDEAALVRFWLEGVDRLG